MLDEVRFYAAVTLIGVLGLAVAELLLRHLHPERIPPSEDYETLAPDAALGYRLRPSTHGLFQRELENGGDRIEWSTNRQGYRGDELYDDGRPRVVVYGDSNIQAVFSALEDTFSKRLEERLTLLRGGAVEVVNAGVVGYGPDHYLLRMRSELPALKPAVVVVNIFADNDLGDVLRHRLFDLRAGHLVARPDHYQYPFLSLRHRAQHFANALVITQSMKSLLGIESPAPAKPPPGDVYLAQLERLADITLAAYRKPFSSIMSADHYDIDLALHPDGESAQLKRHLLRAVLSDAKRVAADSRAQILVVVQPSRVDLTSTLNEFNKSMLGRYPQYDPRRLTSTVEVTCRELGIDVLNLYDEFAQNEPETLYFRGDDDHWNDRGQALAAATVAPLVEKMLDAD